MDLDNPHLSQLYREHPVLRRNPSQLFNRRLVIDSTNSKLPSPTMATPPADNSPRNQPTRLVLVGRFSAVGNAAPATWPCVSGSLGSAVGVRFRRRGSSAAGSRCCCSPSGLCQPRSPRWMSAEIAEPGQTSSADDSPDAVAARGSAPGTGSGHAPSHPA